MELVSLTPFPAECLLWEADAGQASLTVIVKMTLRLVHDADAAIASEQLPIGGDEPWDDNPTASLFRPGDRAPLKPRTDILLVGSAYAPGGRPVDRLTAQLKVGDFTKSITITGTRLWTRSAAGFVPGPPLPFEKMPLRYERGPLTEDNPVGVDPASPPLEGAAVGPVLAPIAPATSPCFGPIAAAWRPRRRLLGEAGRFWALAFETSGNVPNEPAPRALDFKFFNAAPADQQTSMLRQRAEIELVNLSPEHATMRTRLPAMRPQVFHVAPNGRPIEVAVRCDTLWIDSDNGIVCLVWRGLTDVPSMSASDVGTVLVVADPQGRRVRYEQVERAWREGVPIEATEPGARDALALRHDAIRSRGEGSAEGAAQGEGSGERKDETRAFGPSTSEHARAVLPFEGGAASPTARPSQSGGLPFGGMLGESGAHPAAAQATSGAHPAAARAASGGEAAPPGDTQPMPAKRDPSAAAPAAGTSAGAASAGVARSTDGASSSATARAGATARAAAPGSAGSAAGHVYTEDDTHDRAPEEGTAKPLPFVERPAMIAVPPATSGPGATSAMPAMIVPPAPAPAPPATRPPSLALGMLPALPGGPPAMMSLPAAPGLPPPPAMLGTPTKEGASSTPSTSSAARAPEPSKSAAPSRPPPPDPMPPGFEPKDIPVATYGSVSAELMIRRGERAKVLESNKLSEPAWARIHAYWTAEMGRETARGESKLLAQFDLAYVETMGRLRTPIGVPEYAAILVAIERGAVDRQLASLSLSLSDLMRVQRVWTRKLAEDPELQKVLGRAVDEARAKEEA